MMFGNEFGKTLYFQAFQPFLLSFYQDIESSKSLIL